MGLDPALVQVVAQLPPLLSKHYLSVTPVVGVLQAAPCEALRPNPAEVDAIFDMPLRFFSEADARHSSEDVRMGTHQYRIHFFRYEAFEVWGLTAGILIAAAEAALGREADFDVLGGGVDYWQLWYDGRAVRHQQPLEGRAQAQLQR